MDKDQELKLYEDIGGIKANQENVSEKLENLTELLVDKSEKWDRAVVVSEGNKDHLDRRSQFWDIATTRVSALNKVAVTVTGGTILGAIGYLFFNS